MFKVFANQGLPASGLCTGYVWRLLIYAYKPITLNLEDLLYLLIGVIYSTVWRFFTSDLVVFVRIYTGLILSILLSALCCYLVFETVNQIRREQHAEFIFSGTFELIQEGIRRQEGDRKQQWLNAVSKLIGSPIILESGESAGLSERQLSSLSQDKLLVESEEQNVKVYSYISKTEVLHGEFNKVAEAHIRIAAYLLLNEIGRLESSKKENHISRLKEFFQFPIHLVKANDLNLDRQQYRRLLRGDVVVTLETNAQGYESVYAFAPVERDLFLKLGEIPVFNATPIPVLLALLLLSVIITAGSAYFLVLRLERRLEKVDKVVAEFGHGNMQGRVEEFGHDSIGRLATTVNGMADRIVNLIQRQREMTQAVSHELRTPIARLKFRLSMLLDDSSSADRATRVAGMNRDIDELNNLVDEILTYQKLDYTGTELNYQNIDLFSLLQEIVEELDEVYPDIEFLINDNGSPLSAYADRHLLHRLLKNLIDNAGKYGTSRAQVSFLLEKEPTSKHYQIRFEIEDDGSGIKPEYARKVFAPFSRLEVSRSKKTGGYGLGLAIAQRIIQLHKGSISVNQGNHLGGAKFVVILPLQNKSDELNRDRGNER